MAEKILNTRFQLPYDTYANWSTKNPKLKKGEMVQVEVPAPKDAIIQAPSVLIKVGDGTHNFNDLAWASGLAADIYDWAKEANKPNYSTSELTNDSGFITSTDLDIALENKQDIILGPKNSIASFDDEGNIQSSDINILSDDTSYFYTTGNSGFTIGAANPHDTETPTLKLVPSSNDDTSAGILIGTKDNKPIFPSGIGVIFNTDDPNDEESTVYIGFSNFDENTPYVKWNNANKTFTYAMGSALNADVDTIIPFEGGNNSLTPKHYVDAQKVNSYTITITPTSWTTSGSEFKYTYSNTNLRASASPIITCTSNTSEYKYITDAEATANTGITFTAKTKPTNNIVLQIIDLG